MEKGYLVGLAKKTLKRDAGGKYSKKKISPRRPNIDFI